MSRNYWRTLIVFGIGALVFFGFGYFAGSLNKASSPYDGDTPHQITDQTDPAGQADKAYIHEPRENFRADESPNEYKANKNKESSSQLFFGDGAAQWLMVLASFVALGISYWALHYLKGTLGATQRANAGFSEASRQQLRAYAFAVNFRPPELAPGKPILTKYDIRNFGQSPARNIRVRHRVYLRRQENGVPSVPPKKVATTARFTLPPGHFLECRAISDQELSADQFQAIKNGRLIFGVRGLLEYNDIYGSRRYTTFSYVLDMRDPSRAPMVVTGKHNKAS